MNVRQLRRAYSLRLELLNPMRLPISVVDPRDECPLMGILGNRASGGCLLGNSARDCFPAPNLERRRYAHQCPLVVHECLQVGNDSIEFGAGS